MNNKPLLCYAGKNHVVRLKVNQTQGVRIAVARILCWEQRKLHICVCLDHLNLYLDQADNNPSWEPDKIEWLV